MLKHGDANPLAVFGMRRLDHCPPHFTSVDFSTYVDDKAITDWIWTNLSGRFYYGDVCIDSSGNRVIISKRASFELGAEASVFGMLLDTFNKPNLLW